MKYLNQMTMNIPARSINEGFARTVVAGFCAQLDPTIEEIGDIKTAVSEAVTNCIVHAYGNNESGKIQITVTAKADKVEIKIKDYGAGIEDVSKAMQPFFTSSQSEERSGMGFTVMQALTDKVKVRSKIGVGTTVTMIKTIDRSQYDGE